MKASDAIQALWLALLLTAAVFLGSAAGPKPSAPAARAAAPKTAATGPASTAGADDATAPRARAASLHDASGFTPSGKHYQRIASSSSYADELLLALAEPERIAALSSQGHKNQRDAFRYGERPLISGPGDLERLLSLHVDLLLINHFGGQAELARAREGGIEVFDLGDMRGVSTLETNIRALATLLGDPARGERLWRRWSLQFHAIARDLPQNERKAAMYLAIYANKLYGGTRGTSYHDVLNAAGLRDLAADQFRDWPQYDPEQLLSLDPSLIITESGMAAPICDHTWLRSLRACNPGKTGVIEIARNVMGNPGLGMLDAALELHEHVYPPR
ncbi:MAG TPA: ABC transporter substrate-binding protein [Polyangiales bacterium]|nr:ABC transporter substrate-binding protein [Polyangiales bacterium]